MKKEDLVKSLSGAVKEITHVIEGKLKDIEVVDVGDVEAVRVGNAVLVTLPKGKDEFLIIKGMGGLTAPKVKKLSEVV